jgi:flagellar biosynthesis protein FliR
MEVYVSQFVVFLMLFVRITALVVTAPVLGYQAVPVQVKVAIGLFLALVFYPMATAHAPVIDTRLVPLVVTALKEVAVGLLLGFVLSLLFAGARFAGDVIGLSMGFSMANVFDPESAQSVSLIGQFLYIVSTLLFILLNGHHFVLESLQLSYAAVPIGGLGLNVLMGEGIIKLTGFMFIIAVKLAAPVIVALFLIDVGLAVLARVVPQINIFMVSFPLKISVGLVMLIAIGPMMIYVFKKLLTSFETDVLAIVKAL